MPPPPPKAPPVQVAVDPPKGKDLNQLLKQIEKGKRLKKTETVDKSGPLIEAPKNSSAPIAQSNAASHSSSSAAPSAPQLGGLFAGGMPKLKSTKAGKSLSDEALNKPPQLPVVQKKAPPPVLPKPKSNEAVNSAAPPPVSGVKPPSGDGLNKSRPPPVQRPPVPVVPAHKAPAPAPVVQAKKSPPMVRPPQKSPPMVRPPAKSPAAERKPPPPVPQRSAAPQAPPSVQSQVSVSRTPLLPAGAQTSGMDSEGRWKFHAVSEMPTPRQFQPQARLYLSGAQNGNSIQSSAVQAPKRASPPTQRRQPPPPPARKVGGSSENLSMQQQRPAMPPRN